MSDVPQAHTHSLTDEVTAEMVQACPECAQIAREAEAWGRVVVQLYSGVAFSTISAEEQARLMEVWSPIVTMRSSVLHGRVVIWQDSGLSIEAFLAEYPRPDGLRKALAEGRHPPPDPLLRPWSVPWRPSSADEVVMEHNHPTDGRVTVPMIDACPACLASMDEHEATVQAAVQLYSGTPFSALSETQQRHAMHSWRPCVESGIVVARDRVEAWKSSGMSMVEYIAATKMGSAEAERRVEAADDPRR